MASGHVSMVVFTPVILAGWISSTSLDLFVFYIFSMRLQKLCKALNPLPGNWIYFLLLKSDWIFESFPSKRKTTPCTSQMYFSGYIQHEQEIQHSAPNSTISFQCPVKITLGLNLLSLKYLEYLHSLSPCTPEYLKTCNSSI